MPPLNLYARVRFFVHVCTRDRGCSAHPAFPAPSCSYRGWQSTQSSGASRRGVANVCLLNASVPHSQSSSPAKAGDSVVMELSGLGTVGAMFA